MAAWTWTVHLLRCWSLNWNNGLLRFPFSLFLVQDLHDWGSLICCYFCHCLDIQMVLRPHQCSFLARQQTQKILLHLVFPPFFASSFWQVRHLQYACCQVHAHPADLTFVYPILASSFCFPGPMLPCYLFCYPRLGLGRWALTIYAICSYFNAENWAVEDDLDLSLAVLSLGFLLRRCWRLARYCLQSCSPLVIPSPSAPNTSTYSTPPKSASSACW